MKKSMWLYLIFGVAVIGLIGLLIILGENAFTHFDDSIADTTQAHIEADIAIIDGGRICS